MKAHKRGPNPAMTPMVTLLEMFRRQFRRRLSAEGTKPASNNRWKSDLVMYVGGWVCMVFGIISRTKARSATNEVPKCRSPQRALLGHHYTFHSSSHVIYSEHALYIDRYLVISQILLDRFGSNLLFGTSFYVSDTQPPSDSCHACTTSLEV